jgi:transposase-like protein
LACASSTAHGHRREELLTVIRDKPGASVSEIAGEMGISPGQVHGLVRKARAERLIVKQGKGFAVK